MMRTLGKPAVVLALAAATFGARGQINAARGSMDLSANMISVNAFHDVLEGVKRPVRGAGGKRPVAKPARLTYTESASVTRKVERNFVASIRESGSDEEVDSMTESLRARDFRKAWAQGVASYGLRRGDMADALASYWATNWAVANRKSDVSAAQVRGIRRQLAPILARDRTLAGLSNAERQEIAEVWMISDVTRAEGYRTALKLDNALLIVQASDVAAARFKDEVKVDLRAVRLTGNGFTKR